MKIPYKICQSCGDKFYKKPNISLKRFLEPRKIYCSVACRTNELKKNAGWNKGVHYSEETLKKMNFSGLEKGRGLRKGLKLPEFSGENHPNWKPKVTNHCPICKKEMVLAPWEAKRKFCSLKCRGLGKRGKNSPVFKGDFTARKLRTRICQMAEYTEWRLSVFRRDNFTCQSCKNSESKPIEAHHLVSYSELKKQYKFDSPETARKCSKLWDISNGQTLCRSCHCMTPTYPKHLSK